MTELRRLASQGDERAKALLALLERRAEYPNDSICHARSGNWYASLIDGRMRITVIERGELNVVAEVAVKEERTAALWLANITVGKRA